MEFDNIKYKHSKFNSVRTVQHNFSPHLGHHEQSRCRPVHRRPGGEGRSPRETPAGGLQGQGLHRSGMYYVHHLF